MDRNPVQFQVRPRRRGVVCRAVLCYATSERQLTPSAPRARPAGMDSCLAQRFGCANAACLPAHHQHHPAHPCPLPPRTFNAHTGTLPPTQEYFDSMPWLAVPFKDDQLRSVLSRKFNVSARARMSLCLCVFVCGQCSCIIHPRTCVALQQAQRASVLILNPLWAGLLLASAAGRQALVAAVTVLCHQPAFAPRCRQPPTRHTVSPVLLCMCV